MSVIKKLFLFSVMLFAGINLVGMTKQAHLDEQIAELIGKKEQAISLMSLWEREDKQKFDKTIRTSIALQRLAKNTAQEAIGLMFTAGSVVTQQKLNESKATPEQPLREVQNEYLKKWKSQDREGEIEGLSLCILDLFFKVNLEAKLMREIEALDSQITQLQKQKKEQEHWDGFKRLFDAEG